MSKIDNIEREIQKLSPPDLARFRKWFVKYDAEAWDREIEEDAMAGKLDALADVALKAFEAGECTEI